MFFSRFLAKAGPGISRQFWKFLCVRPWIDRNHCQITGGGRVKERHWNSLVGSLRHGHCILMLGSEIPVSVASTDPKAVTREDTSLAEELKRQLALELEEDNR